MPAPSGAGTRPLVGARPYEVSSAQSLEPYFFGCCRQSLQKVVPAYEAITASVAQSTCERAGIGNWVEFEYPLWAGLQRDRWAGVLSDFNVHNQTTKLESAQRPCASITQVGNKYRTPRNRTVNAQFGNLAVAIDADDAATVHTTVPRFSSSVPALGGHRSHPGLNGHAFALVTCQTVRGVTVFTHGTTAPVHDEHRAWARSLERPSRAA